MNPDEAMFCETCGQAILNHYEAVDPRDSEEEALRWVCLACHNKAEAAAGGLASVPVQYPPLTFTDLKGEAHTFYCVTRLAESLVSLEAYEQEGDPGYEFVVMGPVEEADKLYLKLQGKIRRGLSYQHLREEEGRLVFGEEQIVRGTLSWDEESEGSFPLLIVDGKELSWEELGQLLSEYEGWQFKLELFDVGEER